MNRVKIYTKRGCVYCDKLKQLFLDIGLTCDEINMELLSQNEIIDLKLKSNMKTVPIVYIDNHLIGGYTEFNELVVTNTLSKKFNIDCYPF